MTKPTNNKLRLAVAVLMLVAMLSVLGSLVYQLTFVNLTSSGVAVIFVVVISVALILTSWVLDYRANREYLGERRRHDD